MIDLYIEVMVYLFFKNASISLYIILYPEETGNQII